MIFSKNKSGEFKRWHLIILGVVFISSIFLHWYYNRMRQQIISVGGRDFTVWVADTNAKRVQGLSDRDNLLDADGMLFTTGGKPGFYVMVMRRMKFPIDVVWINNKKIVDMAPNLQPDKAENEADLIQYRPRLEATEILEFPAGFVAKYGLKIGDSVIIGKMK